ncbi:GDSL esterase/lipase [Quillaja saponaria]|uniref:GDSL esterase/lipase n=1 Tax=Quillaja saponaria TaxID=32244 RepID=A0AAD7KQW9_QUISA|nr:GDSL esterase/lipase [Quillaja saponaria]
MASNYLILCFLSISLSPNIMALRLPPISALYVFGDSLVDSGNNNYLPTKARANFPPFGIDFGGNATGRFTNGKTVVDFIAEYLDLPFSPPYMGLTDDKRSITITGINYASGACGIFNETSKNESCLAFYDQVELFQKTVDYDLRKKYNQTELNYHLSQSLFFVSMGANDYTQNLKKAIRNPDAFAWNLLQEFSTHLQKLYQLGARMFLVNNIPPTGCLPTFAYRTRPQGYCNKTINRLIASYNRKLPVILLNLQFHLPNSTFLHSNYFKFFLQLRRSARNYGIRDIWRPCCPNRTQGDFQCGPYSVPCRNRDTHFFFDIHPSQIVNSIYARRCFNEIAICQPLRRRLGVYA